MFDEIRWAVTHVLTSPTRLRYLLAGGIRAPWFLTRFLRAIVPAAANELRSIGAIADQIPDERLRFEARSSIEGKAYHVAGACILATFLPRDAARGYIEIVAPLESIYDYLDNLCDRHPDVDASAYPILHQAIADALDPSATPRAYYAKGPIGDDGGYLRALVVRTQRALQRLPGHEMLAPYFHEAAALYAEMQTFKHLPPEIREDTCIAWYQRHRHAFPELTWYEFACAAGSQFQVYAPLYMLFAGETGAVDDAYRAYFPYVASFHVLLDAFIDQAEDDEHGELNFAKMYDNERQLEARVGFLASSASTRFAALPHGERHRFVLRTMALFYLTHPKVFTQGLDRQARSLLLATE